MPHGSLTDARGLKAGQSSVDPSGERELGHTNFFTVLFRSLDGLGISYCVIPAEHAVSVCQSSPTRLVMSPRDEVRLPAVLDLLRRGGYSLVEHTQESLQNHRFTFLSLCTNVIERTVLQLSFAQFVAGQRVFSGDDILNDRQQKGAVWAASPEGEFRFLLAAATATGRVSSLEVERLRELAQQMSQEQARSIAETLCGVGGNRKVVEACRMGRIQDLLGALRRQIWLGRLRRHPLKTITYLIRRVVLPRNRSGEPTGAVIVLLGPDGVGKSTVAKFLSEDLRPLFSVQRSYHWRPGLLGWSSSDEPVTDPHRSPPRGQIASMVYLLVFFLDNILGFVFQISPILVRRGLIIFDRSFSDVLVDPRRYRYGGPHWAALLLERLVPPREALVVVLDASETSILSRKNELSSAEVLRQRNGYRRLVENTSKETRVVSTDDGLDDIRRQVLHTAVAYFASRFSKRHGICSFCSSVA